MKKNEEKKLPGGARPILLLEPEGPQGFQRHAVVHIVNVLDVPVPATGAFMKMHDTQSPVEQVIAVPKISSNRIPQRFVDRPSAVGGTVGGSADRACLRQADR